MKKTPFIMITALIGACIIFVISTVSLLQRGRAINDTMASRTEPALTTVVLPDDTTPTKSSDTPDHDTPEETRLETSGSASMTGADLAEKVYGREDGTTLQMRIQMTLIDKNGHERRRLLAWASRDEGPLLRTRIVFLEPGDIAQTKFLSIEQPAADDIQYLFLPALGRARRIVNTQQSLRFVNTDFTYEDMQRRKPDRDAHTLHGRETLRGHPCFILESIPQNLTASQYSRRVTWIEETTFLILRIDFYDHRGGLIKQLTVDETAVVDGYLTAMTTRMHDFKDAHTTVLKIETISYNTALRDDLFEVHMLEQHDNGL